ncbi:MAG: nuclear transport factor 2 family protein [Gilvibacter sp.]
MKKLLIVLLLCFSAHGFAQDYQKDLDAVKEASFGYMDIFYKADTILAHKYIDKTLRKVGWSYSKEKGAYSGNNELPFDKVIELAMYFKKKPLPQDENTPREVEVLEVNDKIAIVKVTALWGIDYLNLVKLDGKWKIINIVWQSPPKWTYRPEE